MATNQLVGSTDRARIAGSGFTVFTWANSPILYARQVSHQSPQPVGPGPVSIHPMDTPYPVEIITPQAASAGTITLDLYELFGSQVWERLAGLGKATGDGPVDIVGIYKAIANTAKPIRVFKYVKPPSIRGRQMRPYTEEYHNVIVASVEDGETIEVGTMEVLKQVQLQYTHMTRGGRNNVLNNLNVGRDSSTSPPSRYR
jgi:hypothetical protein